MSQPVIMKSNKYGINLILNPNIPFGELLGYITDKFLESEKFFKNAHVALSFEGRVIRRRRIFDFRRHIQSDKYSRNLHY